MIKIEKIDDSPQGFLLRLGEKQSFDMSAQDLRDLHHSLTETYYMDAEDAPVTNFRILSCEQGEHEFEARYCHEDQRDILSIGQKKWHVNGRELTILEINLNKLLGIPPSASLARCLKELETSKDEIWLYREGKNEGPYSTAEALQMLAEGKADKETHACQAGWCEWGKLGDLVSGELLLNESREKADDLELD